MRSRAAAFTLLEILAVIAILGVLAALVIPVTRQTMARSQSAACLQNLRQIGTAFHLYLAENGMILPGMESGRASFTEDVPVMDTVLAPYAGSPGIFRCPSDRSFFESTGSSYFWNSTLNGQHITSLNFLSLVTDTSKIPLIYDKEGWHCGSKTTVNFLYADGRAADELQTFSSQ